MVRGGKAAKVAFVERGANVKFTRRKQSFTSSATDDRDYRLQLAEVATRALAVHSPEFSASSLAHRRAKLQIIAFTFTIAGLLVWSSSFRLLVLYMIAALFLTSSTLRILTLVHAAKPSRGKVEVPREALPVYTVLVPVYDEAAVIAQTVSGLMALSYPTRKLDIKILVEEDDASTKMALQAIDLPSHIQVLVVPRGKPRTKPRALNFGLLHARGEFLTIFDGEDIAKPRQLIEAVKLFRSMPRLACAQARLSYFNADENWLTRQFALEYAVHFGSMLPTLARTKLPMPLGGTSNHFRVSVLLSCGGWDPYNVTEDADLGLRLARLGYTTTVLDSSTLEEAVGSKSAWLKQRARWHKGFLMTWLVHARKPLHTLKDIGLLNFWVATAQTLGAWLNAMLHPIMLLTCLWSIWGTQTFVQALITILGLFALTVDYIVYAILGVHWLKRTYGTYWISTILTFPAYWLLSHLAAWIALHDLLLQPFHWRKTQHGVSRLSQPQAK